MAQYKIQRRMKAYTYEAKNHFDCLPTRVHDADEIEGGRINCGITYFLPGGGTAFGCNQLESIYYILEGEMTLKTDDEETVLHAGDSFHCCPGCNKQVTNNGTDITRMLVVLLPASK